MLIIKKEVISPVYKNLNLDKEKLLKSFTFNVDKDNNNNNDLLFIYDIQMSVPRRFDVPTFVPLISLYFFFF